MHELSIAVNIVEIAQEQMARHQGERVLAVYLKLGPLAGIVKEALLFSFPLACAGTAAEGARIIIEDGEGQDLEIVQMEIDP